MLIELITIRYPSNNLPVYYLNSLTHSNNNFHTNNHSHTPNRTAEFSEPKTIQNYIIITQVARHQGQKIVRPL